MLYKTLGFAVWKAAKWYLGRKVKPGRRFVGVALRRAGAARAVELLGVEQLEDALARGHRALHDGVLG